MNEELQSQIAAAGQTPESPQEVDSQQPVEQSQPTQQEPDIGQLVAQAFNEDPVGTLQMLAEHAGYQLVPAGGSTQQDYEQQLPQQPDPWQQLMLSIALKMWQSEASKQVEEMARADGIELTDQELQQIFLDALEKYQGDVETAYSKFALPKLRSKRSQPPEQREKDVESSGDLLAAIRQAGYR